MGRKTFVVVLLLCLLVSAIPLSFSSQPVTAGESYVVKAGAVGRTVGQYSEYSSIDIVSGRKLAMTSDGHVHIVYQMQDVSGIMQVYHSESSDGGATWTEDQVTNGTRDQGYPSLAVDSYDVLHLVWQDGKMGAPGVVPYVYYSKKTTSWQVAELVASYAEVPAIAIDGSDDVHVVYGPYEYWPGYMGGGNGIRWREKTSAGWQAEEQVSESTSWVGSAAIAIDGNDNVHVVFNNSPRSTYYDMHYRERTSSGWGTEVQINTENDNRGGTEPSMAIDSMNNVHIVWWYPAADGSYSIRHREFTTSWQPVEDVEGPTTYIQQNPVIATDRQGHLHVVWSGQDSASPTYLQIRHREYDTSWLPIEDLTSSTSNSQLDPSLMWANYPEISGVKTNLLEDGFSFVWMDGTTIKYYTSGTAISPPGGLAKISPDNNPLPAFEWNTVTSAVSYEVRMDSAAWTNIGNRLTYVQPTVLSMGSHVFWIRAVDASANPGLAATLFFSVSVAADLTNTKIAFISTRTDGAGDIYIMNTDGSGQTGIALNAGADYNPSWSPDGSRIAFQCSKDGNREIYIMNSDGSSQTRITNNPADDGHPDWSPDGYKIIFDSDRDGIRHIYVMNTDGSGQTQITSSPLYDTYPNWSPDGTKIVFAREQYVGGPMDIYVMNADGTGQTPLTSNPDTDYQPEWSPDGSKIAFDSIRGGQYDVYVMNPDGTGQTALTSNPAWDYEPTWSPDGSRIAFSSTRDGQQQIYVMNSDGSNQTRLTNSAAWDYEPEWSPSPVTVVNTPVGSPVTVVLSGVTVTFNSVTVAGDTAVVQESAPCGSLPSGYTLRGPVYHITTTASCDGNVTVSIPYPSGIATPDDLRLFHCDGASWHDVTIGPVDTIQGIVHGEDTALSWWALVDPPEPSGGGGGGGGRSAPVFPSIYIGIGAALGAGIVAYAVRRRLAAR